MYNLFICSPVDGHLGCFQFYAITNKVAKNFFVKFVYGHAFPILVGEYLEMEWLDHMEFCF